jgi:hypothetical protein
LRHPVSCASARRPPSKTPTDISMPAVSAPRGAVHCCFRLKPASCSCLKATAASRVAALSIVLSLIVRCDSRRAGADRCLTCLDGEARDPREDVALLAHGTGWMSPYQRDRYFEYGVLDRA